MNSRCMTGVSLIELMITVAVLGIIAVIAVPLVNDYITTGRVAVLRENIQSIRLFQDDYRQRNRTYVEGTYDPASPNEAGGIKDLLGWEPRTDRDTITYVVACETDSADTSDPNCRRTSGYTVTATNSDYPDDPLCMGFAVSGSGNTPPEC